MVAACRPASLFGRTPTFCHYPFKSSPKSGSDRPGGWSFPVHGIIIDGWTVWFAGLGSRGQSATWMKAEHLAREYGKARALDLTEDDYIRLIEAFDFAAHELVGAFERACADGLRRSP